MLVLDFVKQTNEHRNNLIIGFANTLSPKKLFLFDSHNVSVETLHQESKIKQRKSDFTTRLIKLERQPRTTITKKLAWEIQSFFRCTPENGATKRNSNQWRWYSGGVSARKCNSYKRVSQQCVEISLFPLRKPERWDSMRETYWRKTDENLKTLTLAAIEYTFSIAKKLRFEFVKK